MSCWWRGWKGEGEEEEGLLDRTLENAGGDGGGF